MTDVTNVVYWRDAKHVIVIVRGTDRELVK